jgi:hypothetical protein
MKNLEKLFEKPVTKKSSSVISKTSRRALKAVLIVGILIPLLINRTQAQCGAGTQQAILNWDYLDYFTYTGWYTSANGYLQSNAAAQTQNFAFGTQRLTITHNYADANSFGENTTHTGEAGTFGNQNGAAVDADIQFRGDGTIILTFENEVSNLRFSMYDVDVNQRVQLDARNAANVAQNVSMTRFSVALTIANNNTPTANATANGTNFANGSVNAALDITVAGPVRRITINITNTGTSGGETGDFWMSDILACIVGTFPTNYYQVSRPFTGQPGYVLHAFGRSVYAVNPANGVTKLVFTDASGPGFINSMGYDPYNRILYYVYSLTSNAGTNRALMKYDFNTQTISTVLADVRSIGVQLVTSTSGISSRGTGVESGAGAFYNGSFYLGIETPNRSSGGLLNTSNREAVIYRIDFDASGNPTRSSQVFALPTDDGVSVLTHDWSDFAISNGILYDFDGAGSTGSAQLDIYEFNMLNGVTFNNTTPAFTPGQNAVDWQENVYDIYALATGTGSPILPYIAPYNKTLGTIGTTTNITSTPPYTPAIPSLGDAAEAYRPLMDFGDAPASYDPDPLAPAVHETLANLRLGGAPDIEWLGQNSALADGDGADEDGLGAAPPLLDYGGTLTYSININVFNNTGANATLAGWLDYNFNNVFDPGEGRSVTVPTSAVNQLVTLTWTSITVNATSNVRTFIRFRLAPTTDGMTVNNPTGYIPNGEVEDYPVLIGASLPNSQLKLQAAKDATERVTLNWEHESDIPVKEFRVQKSENGRNWQQIGTIPGSFQAGKKQYAFTDPASLNTAKAYYRLEMLHENGRVVYSVILSVQTDQLAQSLKIYPNPASHSASLTVYAASAGDVKITITDQAGRAVWNNVYGVSRGNNTLVVDGLDKLGQGIYYISIKTNEKTETTRLMISR